MHIADNTVVTIDYKLTDPSGQVLDSSEDSEPLTYLHGSGVIVPGLEKALAGKQPGDAVSVTVGPEEAYGARDEDLVQSMPRNKFPEGDVEIGMQFRAEEDDDAITFTVVGLDDTTVTIDANHPLAGLTLAFDVKVVEVRAATAEELEHGHVHGPDDHHH